jgi:hypothetical protein
MDSYVTIGKFFHSLEEGKSQIIIESDMAASIEELEWREAIYGNEGTNNKALSIV